MAAAPSPVPRVPKKRIVVCCDGTWMDSDGDYQVPSNVTRIARAIPPSGLDTTVDPPQPIHQLICYVNGVGTGSKSLYNTYVGGATGEGLAEHIREAYTFVCFNYNDGDEIFLLGFSRGAFTARSISSLINAVGLLTPKGLEFFTQVFQDWEFQQISDFKTRWPDIPFPGHKPPVTSENYREEMRKRKLTRPGIKVKCVAVWDTVGGLGIPMIGLLPQPPSKDFAFVDTKVETNIEYAFQALALDEHRRAYSPTIWDWPSDQPNDLKVLKQTWFPGVHSDIGGSYDDTALANLTLAWMVSLFDQYKLLTIDKDYIMECVHPTAALLAEPPSSNGIAVKRTSIPRAPTHGTTRPWGLGKIHNSMTPFFRLGGSRTRTPLEYREQELASQHGTVLWVLWKLFHRVARSFGHAEHLKPRLARTNETMHSSVRIRMGKHGLGYDDKGTYSSQAIQGWVMHGVETNPDTPIALNAPGQVGQMKNVVWKKEVNQEKLQKNGTVKVVNKKDKGKESPAKTTLEIPEEPLGAFEREILRLWPEINKIFDTLGPGEHEHKVNKASTYPINGGGGSGSRSGSGGWKRGSQGVADVERLGSSSGKDGLTLDTGNSERRRSETA